MRYLTTIFLALLALSTPALGGWDIAPSTVTWQGVGPTADVNEVRDAWLWQRDQQPGLWGAVMVAAQPDMSVTDIGGGQSRLDIVMPRAPAESWVLAVSTARCPEASTNGERLQCVNEEIRQSLKQLVQRYRNAQQAPVSEPDELEDP